MPARKGRLFLGTSGFGYAEWRGSFYPATIKAKEMLPFYAARFNATEVNYTFRTTPTEKALSAWRDATPETFVFTIKAHMRITHVLRLGPGAAEFARTFLAALAPLGARTGPVLFQCPPTFAFDEARVTAFLAALPDGFRYAFEFRHPSWDAARPFLAARGVAWCVAETDEETPPEDALDSGTFHYLRLRKTDYSAAELKRWAKRIDAARAAGRDVFCFFKHEETGSGPRFAAKLAAALAD